MDHVQEPAEPVYPPLRVPCISAGRYNGREFSAYPASQGIDKWALIRGDYLEESNKSNLHSFLQSWFFFGMLFQVFKAGQISLKEEEFVIKEPAGQMWLTTGSLLLRIEEWQERSLLSPEPRRRKQLENVNAILEQATEFARALISATGPHTAKVALPPVVSASILHLLCTLCDALDKWKFAYCDSPDARYSAFSPAFSRLGVVSTLVLDRLKEPPWCPSEGEKIRQYFQYESDLYYLSQLKRRAHHSDHASCSERQCLVNQIDVSTYRSQHCCSIGSCEHMLVQDPEITRILRSGGLPLLKLIVDQDEALRIETIEAAAGLQYTAISHVWSHGLGNPTENSLPLCQILRLARLVAPLQGTGRRKKNVSVNIWIDTLCVPLEYETRKLAIGKMCDIYTKARQVLVIDAELCQMDFVNTLEGVCRIFVSDWAKRLWTLQEGDLSETLFFQFANGAFNLCDLPKEVQCGEQEPDREAWYCRHANSNAYLLIKLVNALNLHLDKDDDDHDLPRGDLGEGTFLKLLSIPDLLEYRSTSNKDDEPLCLAGILGQNPAELLPLSAADGMVKLFSRCSQIPLRFIFHPASRIQQDGYRWAPETFIGFTSQEVPSLNEEGLHDHDRDICHWRILPGLGNCLEVQCPGYVLEPGQIDLPLRIELKPPKTTSQLRRSPRLSQNGDATLSFSPRFSPSGQRQNPILTIQLKLFPRDPVTKRPLANVSCRDFALILRNTPASTDIASQISNVRGVDSALVDRFQMRRDQDGRMRAVGRYVCPVDAYWCLENDYSTEQLRTLFGEPTTMIRPVQYLDYSQLWCIW